MGKIATKALWKKGSLHLRLETAREAALIEMIPDARCRIPDNFIPVTG
jgi:hypothetical protein